MLIPPGLILSRQAAFLQRVHLDFYLDKHLLHTLPVIKVCPVPFPQALHGLFSDSWDGAFSNFEAKLILDTPFLQYQASGICWFELHPFPIGELNQVLQNPSSFRH